MRRRSSSCTPTSTTRSRCARSPSAPAWSRRRSGRTSATASRSSPPARQAGTDYADLTGEPEFVDRMYVRHHAAAVATGARIVHACGFDSIPHDLGVLFTVEQLPEGVPLAVRGFVSAGGKPSAGTFHSAVHGFSRVRQTGAAHLARRRMEPRPARKVSSAQGPRCATSARSAPGRCRCRRSTRRSSSARPARSSATGPTSPTATTPPSKQLPVALGGDRRRRRGVRARPAAADALLAAGADAVRRGPVARAARAQLVQGPLHRRGRRPARRDGGRRRRPGLRRDRQDARRVGALPRHGRPPADRGPGHDRGRDGRCADRAPAAAGHHVRAARVELSSPRSARP